MAKRGKEKRGIVPAGPIGAEEILARINCTAMATKAPACSTQNSEADGDIDHHLRYGFGFPVKSGGRCFYAGHGRAAAVLSRVPRNTARASGTYWEAGAVLERLVAEGRGFYQGWRVKRTPLPAPFSVGRVLLAPRDPHDRHRAVSSGRRIGQEIAISDWMEGSRRGSIAFADATAICSGSTYDPGAAAAGAAVDGTIAHGFLTLSLSARLIREAIQFCGRGWQSTTASTAAVVSAVPVRLEQPRAHHTAGG